MRKRALLTVPLALLAVLVFAGAALAGGWASVTMADPPSDIPPGEETSVELTVLQHGKTPVDWPKITVVATNADSGAVVRSEAHPVSGKLGRYAVALTFPTAGEWEITYQSKELVMDGTASLNVTAAAPVAAAVAAAPAIPATTTTVATSPAAGQSNSLLLPALFSILALSALSAVAIFGVVLFRRRSQPTEHHDQPASARG